jgi:hypothetical protein
VILTCGRYRAKHHIGVILFNLQDDFRGRYIFILVLQINSERLRNSASTPEPARGKIEFLKLKPADI